VRVRVLASVVGQEGLGGADRRYLAFAERFERSLVAQDGARALDASMALAWQCLRELPRGEMTRLSDAQIDSHLAASDAPPAGGG
jgi:V/A-type H+/Na+-transporting ATPase subunit B